MDHKRFIDGLALSVAFLIFSITLFSVDQAGQFLSFSLPIGFYQVIASISFSLFVLFTISLFKPSIMVKYDHYFTQPPTTHLGRAFWTTFLGLFWSATLIGLVGGILPLIDDLPNKLKSPALSTVILWPIIVIIALVILVCRRTKKVVPPNVPPSVSSEPTGIPSIGIVYDETRKRLDFQFDQLDGLSNKAGMMLGFSGVVFTLLITFLLDTTNTTSNMALARIALAIIFIAMFVSFISIYILKWSRPLNIERLRWHYISEDVNKTQIVIIDECRNAIKQNEIIINRIIGLIKCAYVLLLVGFSFIAVWVWFNVY
jgi:hypothetical protein